MSTSRLEAFSDGVLAIIITIMVLGLPMPNGASPRALVAIWQPLFAYVLSFTYVGIYWNNHHHLLSVAPRVDGTVLWANLHLLFWLSLFPLVTNWAGRTGYAPFPMAAYAGVALLCALAYAILSQRLLRANADDPTVRMALASTRKEWGSIVAYLLACLTPLAGPVGTVVCGLLLIGVATVWFVPDPRVVRAWVHTHPDEDA